MQRKKQGVNERLLHAKVTESAWYRALPLSERLNSWNNDSSHVQAADDEQRTLAQHKLGWWKELPSFQDHPAAFAERLAAEELSEEQLLTLLAEPVEALQQRLPDAVPWVETLKQAFTYQSQPAYLEGDQQAMVAFKNLPGGGGFLPIFTSFLFMAHDHLRDYIRQRFHALSVPIAPFDPNTVAGLFLPQLAQQVVALSSKVLVLELHLARERGILSATGSEERFVEFVHQCSQPGAMIALLERYPVLGRWLVAALERWQQVALELLFRLCDDWSQICTHLMPDQDPGVLIGLEGNAGDAHRGGRAVCILLFQSGTRLVYKPRSLAVDCHFQELLVWINEQHILPPLQTPNVLNRGTYGWSAFVGTQDCTSIAEVERFMLRLGAYLALLSMLSATDMHADNICAAGEHPILFDLECLFHSTLNRSPSSSLNPAIKALHSSVLTTGLLPYRLWSTPERPGIDLSGMQAAAPQIFPLPQPCWDQAKTDQMRMTWQLLELSPAHNRPRLQAQEVEYCQYQDQILTGFTLLYRLFMEQRTYLLAEFLPRFAQDEIRHVVRPTVYYGLLLREQTHPDVVQDALDQERYLDRLWQIADTHLHLPQLVIAERADLWAGDIPIFWTTPDSRSLFTTAGTAIPEMLEESGLEAARTRLLNLCEKDLTCQDWIIRASLMTNAPEGQRMPAVLCSPRQPGRERSQESVTAERLRQAAFALGDRLTSLVHLDGNDVGWLTIAPLYEHEWKIRATDSLLYRGLAGIALFLAYLGQVGPCERSTRLARRIVQAIEQQETPTGTRPADQPVVGCFQGQSGICYLLAHLGVLWQDETLLTAAHQHALALTPLIKQDEHLDIISGSAGCIAALLALHAVRPSTELLAVVTASADHLIQRLDLASACTSNNHAHWIHARQRDMMTGFSHGAAGMAFSLLRLATVTGESSFRRAAQVLLAYERSCFSPLQQNWPQVSQFRESASPTLQMDFAFEPVAPWFQVGWCHGAAGIGISRLAMGDDLADPLFHQEITTAIQTTLREGFGRNHSLCHGDLGNLELLLMAQQRGMVQYQIDLERLTTQALVEGENQGWVCGASQKCEVPDLMTGLAGIGYQLLRLSSPATLPNVLILAPPLPP